MLSNLSIYGLTVSTNPKVYRLNHNVKIVKDIL